MKVGMRRQPPVKGGREHLTAGLLKEIQRAVKAVAREYNVSASWVVATILADALGIEEQISYKTLRRKDERK